MSFAYVMFFGVGAYGVSLPRYAVDTNWSALWLRCVGPDKT